MKRFCDLKVGDKLYCLCQLYYGRYDCDQKIITITEIEPNYFIGVFEDNSYAAFFIRVCEKFINGIKILLENENREYTYDYDWVIIFETAKDCKEYAIKQIIKRIKQQEELLKNVLLWKV